MQVCTYDAPVLLRVLALPALVQPALLQLAVVRATGPLHLLVHESLETLVALGKELVAGSVLQMLQPVPQRRGSRWLFR